MLLVVVVCWLLLSIAVVALCVAASRADADAADDLVPLAQAPVVRRLVRR